MLQHVFNIYVVNSLSYYLYCLKVDGESTKLVEYSDLHLANHSKDGQLTPYCAPSTTNECGIKCYDIQNTWILES